MEETSAKRLHAWGLIYTWIYTSTHPRPKPQPTRKVGNTWLLKRAKVRKVKKCKIRYGLSSVRWQVTKGFCHGRRLHTTEEAEIGN